MALLSLLFPITAWFALKNVDKEFRNSIEQASLNTLHSLKASFLQQITQNPELTLHGFVSAKQATITLDGEDTEWSAIKAYEYRNNSDLLSVKLVHNFEHLSLFVFSNDGSKSINPQQSTVNDSVIVALANKRGVYKYKFKRQAEGFVENNGNSEDNPEYHAYWHEKAQGYALEVQFKQLDSRPFHHLGIVSINQSSQGKIILGTMSEDSKQNLVLQPIVSDKKNLQKALDDITPSNHHFAVLDNDDRIIYQSNKLPSSQSASSWQWLMTPIYRWLFAIDSSNKHWFYRQYDGFTGVKHHLIEDGIRFEITSMMPQGQQNMIQTLLKAGVLMMAVVLLLMAAYLSYSLFLAWRIKKLNRALYHVLDDSGQLHTQMPSRTASDEIGQLSRSIESMLLEMRQYTHYLKDLGSRLSHEMKTPLAIVQSSLDNLQLEMENPSVSNEQAINADPKLLHDFLQRAQEGTKRLRFILQQLSELSQLKYSLQQTPKQLFNLSALVLQLSKSYQGVIPKLKTTLQSPELFIEGSPELIAQLLDKLMDNAKGYIKPEGYIELSLKENNGKPVLSVFNTDSQLPEKNIAIFDSLVSARNKKDSHSVHLGLGLHFAYLIARFHNAEIRAENCRSAKGVIFQVEFHKTASI